MGPATTARAPRLKQILLAAPIRTGRIPLRRTILRVTRRTIARRMRVPCPRAILLQTGLITRREPITPGRIQLIGPLRSIRARRDPRLQRDRSTAHLSSNAARPNSSTAHPNSSTAHPNSSTAHPNSSSTAHLNRGAIPTQSRNKLTVVGDFNDGPFGS